MAAKWFRSNRKGTVYLGIGGDIYRFHLELWRLGITWEFNPRKRRSARMPRPNLSESSSKWPWWCCGKSWKKIRRIARKVEKRQWPKEERKAGE